jgi:hypothetical protein
VWEEDYYETKNYKLMSKWQGRGKAIRNTKLGHHDLGLVSSGNLYGDRKG